MKNFKYRCLPPDHMLKRGKNTSNFFHIQQNGSNGSPPALRLREMAQNNITHDMPVISKATLEEKIMGFRESDDSSDDEDSIIDNYQGLFLFVVIMDKISTCNKSFFFYYRNEGSKESIRLFEKDTCI